MIINIDTQSTEIPNRIGATMTPDFDTLKYYNWRIADETIPLEEGYERKWIQDPDNTFGAIPIDTSIAERLERERLQNVEANRERWTLENQFIELCDQLTNRSSHMKLGFPELNAIITQSMEVDQSMAIKASLTLLMLDAALKRYEMLWWEKCEWHPEVVMEDL